VTPSGHRPAGTAPLVSLVVCTRDRARLLLRLLHSVAAQQHPPPFEVVVVDNGSTDDTLGCLAGFAE
jgi:glycosyltransferase involved in cell wall biosynthesis